MVHARGREFAVNGEMVEKGTQLADEHQASIRCHARSLELDFQKSVERELKWLVFFFTHRVTTSGVRLLVSEPNENRVQ